MEPKKRRCAALRRTIARPTDSLIQQRRPDDLAAVNRSLTKTKVSFLSTSVMSSGNCRANANLSIDIKGLNHEERSTAGAYASCLT
jgi:hypothetical protein